MLTHLWHLGAMLAPFWLRLGHLGSILPLSWAILAPTWPRWAPSWLRVGHLGSILALSWAILAPTWPSWPDLASPCWLYLGSNLAILAILALPWAMLSSFWAHDGVSWLILWPCWHHLSSKLSNLARSGRSLFDPWKRRVAYLKSRMSAD